MFSFTNNEYKFLQLQEHPGKSYNLEDVECPRILSRGDAVGLCVWFIHTVIVPLLCSVIYFIVT